MAKIVYKTLAGDMVDAIAHKYYQGISGAFEAILAANPGLARLGPKLPEGLDIELPELPVKEEEEIRLWD